MGKKMRTGTEIIKVSSRTMPKLSAGAIAAIIREGGKAEVQAVGAGAANQGIKAVAIARTYMKAENVDLICRPAFAQIEIEGVERTAISLLVEKAIPEDAHELL
ncbi:MAG: stage V sporulation protein S [Oscillospiraceae bacterium]|nr:stage V sporulation protein S [Oscillospiraceae bacterium]